MTTNKPEESIGISALANDANVSIEQQFIKKNQVSEVTVVPKPSGIGKAIELAVTATRGSVVRNKVVPFEVIEGEDDRLAYAAELRDKFVTWLAKNKPERNINSNCEWIGTMVSPQWLVVSH